MPPTTLHAHHSDPPATHRVRHGGLRGATIAARGQMAGEENGFGRWLRALRVSAGLTQAELAEVSGISERTVSDVERGLRGTVYPATARQLASALAVGDERL